MSCCLPVGFCFPGKAYRSCTALSTTTLQVHLKELNELVKKLATLDAPVPEQDQAILLLISLLPRLKV